MTPNRGKGFVTECGKCGFFCQQPMERETDRNHRFAPMIRNRTPMTIDGGKRTTPLSRLRMNSNGRGRFKDAPLFKGAPAFKITSVRSSDYSSYCIVHHRTFYRLSSHIIYVIVYHRKFSNIIVHYRTLSYIILIIVIIVHHNSPPEHRLCLLVRTVPFSIDLRRAVWYIWSYAMRNGALQGPGSE